MGRKEGKKMNRGSAGQNKKKSYDFLEKKQHSYRASACNASWRQNT